jgi:DNA invertase Pin-like site-specific DNA recombinase
MRAVIYTRVSQDSTGRGRSVEEQLAECERVCVDNGWTVAAVHSDNDRSASRYAKKARPGWDGVKHTISAGDADVLVVWESSRATRDLAEYARLTELCRANNVRLCTGGRVVDFDEPGDVLGADIQAAVDRNESDRTSKRIRRATARNAERGRPHGKIPYGYRRVYDTTSGELLSQEPHPEQSAVVIDAATRLLAGESARSVCRDLNDRGVPIPRPRVDGDGVRVDKGWQLGQLTRLLRNPLYAGLRVHRGEVVGDADWPALIDRASWERLQAVLGDPSRRTGRSSPDIVHLLAGVARCGVCGGPCVHTRNGGFTDRAGRVRPLRTIYACRYKHCVARTAPDLEAFVTEVVLERLSRPDALPVDDSEGRTTEAVARVRELRSRLDEAVAAFTAGDLSAMVLGRIEADLVPSIAEAERAARYVGMSPVVGSLLGTGDVRTGWDELTVEQRRNVVRSLLTVTILPAGRGRRSFDPDTVRVEWTV